MKSKTCKFDVTKMTPEEYRDEMYRISHVIMTQGDVDCIVDMLSDEQVKQFVDEWHREG